MMMEAVIIGSLNIPKHGPSMTQKMRTACAQTDLNTRSIHVMETQMWQFYSSTGVGHAGMISPALWRTRLVLGPIGRIRQDGAEYWT